MAVEVPTFPLPISHQLRSGSADAPAGMHGEASTACWRRLQAEGVMVAATPRYITPAAKVEHTVLEHVATTEWAGENAMPMGRTDVPNQWTRLRYLWPPQSRTRAHAGKAVVADASGTLPSHD